MSVGTVRERVRATWTRHNDEVKPMLFGVAAALVLALVVVAADTKFSEDDEALVGKTVAFVVPALAVVFLLLNLRSASLRLGFGTTALALVTLYPFLLPDTPWWALGPAVAVHLVVLWLHLAPTTRLGVAALGAPILVQAAYRDDLGPYNPLVAGLLLAAHLILAWLLLPPLAESASPWRRVPQGLFLGGLVLVFLGAGYSLTREQEWARMSALVGSAVLAVAAVRLPARHDAVRLSSILRRATQAPLAALPKA